MSDIFKQIYKLNNTILDMEAQGDTSVGKANEIGGLQATLQGLINSVVPNPIPNFPPNIHDKPSKPSN